MVVEDSASQGFVDAVSMVSCTVLMVGIVGLTVTGHMNANQEFVVLFGTLTD